MRARIRGNLEKSLLALGLLTVWTIPAQGQDTAQEPPAGTSSPASEATAAPKAARAAAEGTPADETPPRAEIYDRWEDAFDIKLTSLYEHKAADLTSPTVVFAAAWNYRFPTNTYIGLAMGGVPQSIRLTQAADGSTRHLSLYYAGLNVAQSLYDNYPVHVAVSAAGGVGLTYLRYEPADGSPSKVHSPKFNYVEPAFYATVYEWHGLELGGVVSYRYVQVAPASDVASNKDLSSLAYGLTFRVRH